MTCAMLSSSGHVIGKVLATSSSLTASLFVGVKGMEIRGVSLDVLWYCRPTVTQ